MINLCKYLRRSVPPEGNSKCKGPEVRVMCKRDSRETNMSGKKEANGKIESEDREVERSQTK